NGARPNHKGHGNGACQMMRCAAHHANGIGTFKDIAITNHQKNDSAKNLEGFKTDMQYFLKKGFTGLGKNNKDDKADQAALNQCHIKDFGFGITDNSEHINTHQEWIEQREEQGKGM